MDSDKSEKKQLNQLIAENSEQQVEIDRLKAQLEEKEAQIGMADTQIQRLQKDKDFAQQRYTSLSNAAELLDFYKAFIDNVKSEPFLVNYLLKFIEKTGLKKKEDMSDLHPDEDRAAAEMGDASATQDITANMDWLLVRICETLPRFEELDAKEAEFATKGDDASSAFYKILDAVKKTLPEADKESLEQRIAKREELKIKKDELEKAKKAGKPVQKEIDQLDKEIEPLGDLVSDYVKEKLISLQKYKTLEKANALIETIYETVDAILTPENEESAIPQIIAKHKEQGDEAVKNAVKKFVFENLAKRQEMIDATEKLTQALTDKTEEHEHYMELYHGFTSALATDLAEKLGEKVNLQELDKDPLNYVMPKLAELEKKYTNIITELLKREIKAVAGYDDKTIAVQEILKPADTCFRLGVLYAGKGYAKEAKAKFQDASDLYKQALPFAEDEALIKKKIAKCVKAAEGIKDD
ncbi:hypothetical protein KY346_04080 [Candidatus Woesearchaeota archaeon]|nr:hypothetical protein [Candidatus Woesearchaeota archaeon]